MNPLVRSAVVFGVLLLAVGLAATSQRRGLWALALAVGSVGAGLIMGVLVPTDLWMLSAHTGLGREIALIGAWTMFGLLFRAAGRPAVPGPPWMVAAAAGLLMGELGAGAMAGVLGRDKPAAARLALAGMGGAMLGRVSEPATLMLGSQIDWWWLAPLGLACVAAARVRPGDIDQSAGSRTLASIGLGVAVVALVPGMALWALLGGCLALAIRGRGARPELMPLIYPVALCALVLVAVAAGGPDLAATGLEEIQLQLGDRAAPGLAACGVLLGALLDGAGGGLVAVSFFDRALSLRIPHAALYVTVGLAVGGLGPLVLAGAVREGLRGWLLQVGLGLAWACALGWLLG